MELEPYLPPGAAIVDPDVLDRGRLVDSEVAEIDAKLAAFIETKIVGDIGEGDRCHPLEDPVGADPQTLETGRALALHEFPDVNICQQSLPLRARGGRAEAGADSGTARVEIDQIFQGEELLFQAERHARHDPHFQFARQQHGALLVAAPPRRPTSRAVAGLDLDRLFIMSARVGPDEEALERQPEAGGLLLARPGAPGLAEKLFAG